MPRVEVEVNRREVDNPGDKMERVLQELLYIGQVVIVHACKMALTMLYDFRRQQRNATNMMQPAETADRKSTRLNSSHSH